MRITIDFNSIYNGNNLRIEPEKVNTRSFSPEMVRFSDADRLFGGAEIDKSFAYQRIFRFAMEVGRDRQLINKHMFVDSNG